MGIEEIRTALRSPGHIYGKDGRALLVRSLSTGQMMKLRDWVAKRPMRDMLETLRGQDLEPAVKTELLRDARDECERLTKEFNDGDPTRMMQYFLTLEGFRMLLKTAAELDHPTLTDAEVAAFVDESNVQEVSIQLAAEINPKGPGSDPTRGSSTTPDSATTTPTARKERFSKRSKRSRRAT